MTSHAPEAEVMEKPPKFARRVELKRGQFIAFLLMAMIPVLAVFRVLGDRTHALQANAGELKLSVEAPSIARYGNPVQVHVTIALGDSAEERRRLTLGISEAYLQRFSEMSSRPPVHESTGGHAVFVTEVAKGAREVSVTIDLTPEAYGWAEGRARASVDTGQSVELAWRTFVFP